MLNGLAHDVAELPKGPMMHELQPDDLPEPAALLEQLEQLEQLELLRRIGQIRQIGRPGWPGFMQNNYRPQNRDRDILQEKLSTILDYDNLTCIVCWSDINAGTEFFRCGKCVKSYCTTCHLKWTATYNGVNCAHCRTADMHTMKRLQNGDDPPDPKDLHPIVGWAMQSMTNDP